MNMRSAFDAVREWIHTRTTPEGISPWFMTGQYLDRITEMPLVALDLSIGPYGWTAVVWVEHLFVKDSWGCLLTTGDEDVHVVVKRVYQALMKGGYA